MYGVRLHKPKSSINCSLTPNRRTPLNDSNCWKGMSICSKTDPPISIGMQEILA